MIGEGKKGTRVQDTLIYKKAIATISKDLRNAGAEDKNRHFTRRQVDAVFRKWKGKCAYCGYPLDAYGRRDSNALYLQLYTPFKLGGEIEVYNLVPCCRKDYWKYRPTKELRERVPDVNTIPDLIDVMIQTRMDLATSENPHLELNKLSKVKKMLNILFEDLAMNMRYKPQRDWVPQQYSVMIEDDSTIPDAIDELVTIAHKQKEGDRVEAKKEVGEKIEQMSETKQYKILRNPND